MLENKLDDFSAAGLSSAMAGFSGAGVPDALAAEPGAEIDLLAAWGLLVGNFAHWTTFATLTFESKKYPDGASSDQARWCWRSLVRYLNHDLFGNHYAEIVHHSYFAYALAFENHKSGLLHCHALMSRRINYSAVHRFWQGEKRPFHIGLVDIKPINKVKPANACIPVRNVLAIPMYDKMTPARPIADSPIPGIIRSQSLI